MRQSESWFTFIVPVYNGEATLPETINSLHLQSCQNFVIHYINDGSTDGSLKLIRGSLRPCDSVLDKENEGLYSTINKAVREVQTEFVVFLFQDDIVKPSFVGEASRFLSENQHIDILYFSADEINGQSKVVRAGVCTSRIDFFGGDKSYWPSALGRGTFWTISGSVCRASALREQPFDGGLPHAADLSFLLDAIRSYEFAYFESPQLAIRNHEGAASHKNLFEMTDLKEYLEVYKKQSERYPSEFSLRLRLMVSVRLVRNTFFRVLGRIRRTGSAPLSKALRLILKVVLWAITGR